MSMGLFFFAKFFSYFGTGFSEITARKSDKHQENTMYF